jgi:hypothetical protein
MSLEFLQPPLFADGFLKFSLGMLTVAWPAFKLALISISTFQTAHAQAQNQLQHRINF